MVQHAPRFLPEPSGQTVAPAHSPRLWGLSASQLHDAYWRSRGVQCVRRGERQPLLRGADLYLLIEPDQMVLFDLRALADHLIWHNAAVTRLRLVDADEDAYSEHVITNDRGMVLRIERRYRPQWRGSTKVMLTPSGRIARLWMAAAQRREGWNRLRRSVSWPQVDHTRCRGRTFVANIPQQERQLIDALVRHWRNPDQVIGGLARFEGEDVWHVEGEPVIDGVVCIGPLWLGRGVTLDDEACVVGPAWFEDRLPPASENRFTLIRDILDIESDLTQQRIRISAASGAEAACKRGFDIAASAAALMVLLPLMLVIGVCVIADGGFPVFFGHYRQGRHGRLFRCWKFRTMRRDAEKIAVQLRTAPANLCDGPQVFIQNDPRVTRIGRFLRRWNLDEFPQFWNVLIGQMSLVGPRPSPNDENQYCPAWRDLRLSVRPGITGLWQLQRTRHKGEDFQEWIKYDIQYVQQMSFWNDLVILFKTGIMLLRGRPSSEDH